MNIFILDKEPVKAAQYQCDRHVVKMTLETTQLLCTAFPNGSAPYKKTHINHPITKWVKQSFSNYLWTINHGLALAREYTFRYGKKHRCQEIVEWCLKNIDHLLFEETGLTPFIQAMPEKYKHSNAVVAYRAFYLNEKLFAQWNHTRKAPEWWAKNKLDKTG